MICKFLKTQLIRFSIGLLYGQWAVQQIWKAETNLISS